MVTSEDCRIRILEYLKKQSMPKYVRARWISKEIGLGSKQVGQNMKRLTMMDTGFKIERYTGTSGCVWKVETV